jgi:predicted transposase/invertase (TIGR01784 family)
MPRKTAVIAGKLEPARFAPFFIDWTFKRVLGKKGGEPLLMAIINDFLARVLPYQIKKIKYLPTELLGVTPKSKKVIFDILCEDSVGDVYLLEMQNAKLKTASDRIRLYISRLQSESIDSGAKSYRLPSNFFIGILNHKRNDSKFYFTEEGWVNLQTMELANKKEFKIFIELPKFDKPAEKCRTFRDKVIFLFKNLHILCDRPENFKEKLFDRIFSISEISRLNGRELKAFRYSMRYVDERQLAIDCAVEEATEEATAVALAIGREQGRKQEKMKSSIRTAKAMLARGYSIAEIIGITNLSRRQIKTLM